MKAKSDRKINRNELEQEEEEDVKEKETKQANKGLEINTG